MVQGNQRYSCRGGLGNLFTGEFLRLARRERLRGNDLDPGSLKFGQGSAKDGFRGAEVFGQFAGFRRTEAGGQRNGQPLEKMSRGRGYCCFRQKETPNGL